MFLEHLKLVLLFLTKPYKLSTLCRQPKIIQNFTVGTQIMQMGRLLVQIALVKEHFSLFKFELINGVEHL